MNVKQAVSSTSDQGMTIAIDCEPIEIEQN
jgi:hypothetical protein